MKYTKRVVSLFIIAAMLLSMLSAFVVVPVMAINPPVVYDDTGVTIVQGDNTIPIYYDTKLNVTGSGVTAGETVNIYWDFVQAAYLLNSTTAGNDGRYTCFIDVPSSYNGSHYVWAKDLSTGGSERSATWVNVWSSLELDPDAGLPGDEVTIEGHGWAAGEYVTIGFYNISGPGVIDNSTMLWEVADEEETDDDGYFSLSFDMLDWDDGEVWVNCTDESVGYANASFTIGPALTIDKDTGPCGTVVKIDGRGFTPSTEINTLVDIDINGVPVHTRDDNNVTATGLGIFSMYIVIPSIATGTYDITVDDGAKSATAEFEVDGEAEIEITPEYGTPGTVLTVKGYNFTRLSGTDVDITLESQEATANCDATGSFTATITIPPLDFGTSYDVDAVDEKDCAATTPVLVALIVLQLSDYSAPVGAEVTLMGSGFTDGGDWNATLGDMDIIASTSIPGGQTYFSHVWYVPSVPAGTYTINVLDETEMIEVGIDFTVTDPAALSLSRADVPNGYNLTIEGINFVEKEAVTTQWYLYNSTHEWDLNTQPNVTYGGLAFVPETDEDGEFTGYYLIPDMLELGSYTINCTTISNAATSPDVTQYAEIDFEIVPEEVLLNVGNPSYARGQTITFVIKATLKKDPFYLGIKDPDGSEVFNSTWDDSHWGTIGSWFYIPSNRQIDDNINDVYSLPADAMSGTWTYEFWDDDKVYASGSFEVTELTEIEQLQQDLGEVASSVLDLGTSVTDLATSLVDVSGAAADASAAAASAAAAASDAKAAADAAAAAVADVGDTANDALDAANDAKSSADAAKTAADSGLAAANDAKATAQSAADAANDARDAAEGAQTAASGLTTLVYGAIGASLIAALAAIVSLMQISRRIAG
jgi:hypothetical protein